ncbi:MAG: hypothetical protein ACHQUC_01505 [Chlamydiales bacterium]
MINRPKGLCKNPLHPPTVPRKLVTVGYKICPPFGLSNLIQNVLSPKGDQISKPIVTSLRGTMGRCGNYQKAL